MILLIYLLLVFFIIFYSLQKKKDNVKFIHASSSLGVVETNLYAEYYLKRFRTARRVIK